MNKLILTSKSRFFLVWSMKPASNLVGSLFTGVKLLDESLFYDGKKGFLTFLSIFKNE